MSLDYEKTKEMNIIWNLRLIDEMGLRQGFEDLLGSNGSGAGKLSGSPSESGDYEDDDNSFAMVDNTLRVTRR